ncbi:MAG TPA: ABC transporter substrate-binding protein [Bryobacteraceae bacterium]|nr:ABC transporter substrate-binding protein [Bryobacteraceae bacterium]
MSRLTRLLLALAAAAAMTPMSRGQAPRTCNCGADPPGEPKNREVRPYANTPDDMRPYGNFAEPYYEFYQKQVEYNGAARDLPTLKPQDVDEVRIGFLGPVENHPDEALGRMMLNGAMLAVEEANARGGYGGKPFRLMVHNDAALWGASSNEIVKMAYDEKVWAMLGSISGDSTHIALRASLKAEVPIVNSASTDPTIPETIIPWYLATVQDDRMQCYTLARRIYTDLGLTRVALLRVNDRYGRFGVLKFRQAAQRLGHPVTIEQKYLPGATDFRRSLGIIADSDAQAIVIWGDQAPAAAILQQMRELGMKQRVFGSFRTIGETLLSGAGTAAEGMEAVFPFDPTRDDPAWTDFRFRFARRFDRQPEVFASMAFDTMNILLDAICRAGLNRGRIRDALAGLEGYKGVTGAMVFDPNSKNVVPLFLATVHDGGIRYRRYGMEKAYAHVGEGGVAYAGPPLADAASGPMRLVVFGPVAAEIASSPEMRAALAPFAGRYVLAPVDAGKPWGQASSELVELLYRGNAIGILAVGRDASHLAEQLAVKMFIPVIALSSDTSLTAVNIPWIFRLPAATAPEEAIRMIVGAAEKAGPNRGRLREELAASGWFDSRGEPLATAR